MTAPLLSFDSSGFQFAWDSTTISAFSRCPRYYQLSYLEGWRSPFGSAHLIFGGIYAAALEHYFKHLTAGATPEEALRQVVHDALIESWNHERDEAGERIPETGGPWESDHSSKTRETLIRSIVWYFDHFASDPAPTVILSSGAPAVEYSFSLELNSDLLYCGHIDRLVTYAGGTYVMDQKTTGSTLTSRYFDQFTPDVQMSGYTWAGKIIFNLPVSGVIIDAAQIAVGFTRFERGFVHRSAASLDEWHYNTLQVIEEARIAHESQTYRMNQTACGNYGGCPFRKVCSRHPEHRPNILQSEFVRAERWDPLKKR